MATGGREEDPNTCPVCLGDFRNPKFLPSCYHTFCAQCIQGLADRHPRGVFNCPYCRRVTSLPLGGVAALQTNFYIQAQTAQQKPRVQGRCKIHPGEKLEFYCVKCDEALCIYCQWTKGHTDHPTDDLNSAASRIQRELRTDQQRLWRAVPHVMKSVASLKEERHSLDLKKAAVEKDIQNRYSTIVAAATAVRDEQLRSLSSLHADMDRDVVNALHGQESCTTELLDLIQQADDVVTSGTASDVITVAREMRSGRGSQRAVDAMMSQERPVQRPGLRFNVSTDVALQRTRQFLHLYMGVVSKMDRHEDDET